MADIAGFPNFELEFTKNVDLVDETEATQLLDEESQQSDLDLSEDELAEA